MAHAQAAHAPEHVYQLQRDIEELRAVNAQVEAAATAADAADAAAAGGLTMDDLNETERSAASLGVAPDEWKPISFMNSAHYDSLLRKNVLSPRLAQQIESYRQVALADQRLAA